MFFQEQCIAYTKAVGFVGQSIKTQEQVLDDFWP